MIPVMKKYRYWTPSAIECYQRGCVCEGCLTGQIMEEHCRMKSSVIQLIKTLGPPQIFTTKFIPGATEVEEEIIDTILKGAGTLKQIAEHLKLSEETIKSRLYSLYRLVENNGYQFKTSKSKNRLPEFIEYVKSLQPKEETTNNNIIIEDDEIEMKGTRMYDEDLQLGFANYLAPIIDAVKKGYESPKIIEQQTGISQSQISAAFNQFAHQLEKLGYVTLKKEISSRQTVINFIQSRLLDPEYKEERVTTKIPDNEKPAEKSITNMEIDLTEKYTEREAEIIDLLLNGLSPQQIAEKLVVTRNTVKTHITRIYAKRNYKSLQELLVNEFKQRAGKTENNSDDTALRAENEQLRKRITELENQAQPVVTLDLSSLKSKIGQEITRLTKKLELIEELEKDVI